MKRFYPLPGNHSARPIPSWKLHPPQLPLRLVLIVPFVLLTTGAVSIVGYLSWRNGQQAVNDLANQLMNQVSNQVALKLDTYLSTPHLINQTNQDAIELGQLNLNDLRQIERCFWRQIQRFDSIISIAVGTQDGEFTGIGRPGENIASGLKVGTAGRETNGDFYIYAVNAQGERTGSPEVRQKYDPRQRPWYVDTVQADKPIWSEIYSDFSDPRLVITANQPIFNQADQLEGVLSIDLLLSKIGEFLQTLNIGQHGQVFIIERSGLLVASSTGENPFTVNNGEVNRIQVKESENSLIRITTEQLLQKFGSFNQIDTTQQISFRLNPQELKQWRDWVAVHASSSNQQAVAGKQAVTGEQAVARERAIARDFFLQVTPLHDQYGLDWLIVIAVPESDFMAQINANTHITLLLSAATLAGVLALGLLATRWINQPIQRLSRASQALAEGNWRPSLQENSPIAELQVLNHAFNRMSEQLQQSFDRVTTALQESENRFTKVFHTSPDAISITVTPGAHYLEVNDCFLDITGYSRDEVIGRTISQLNLIASPEQVQQVQRLLEMQQAVQNLEFDIRTRSGRIRTVLLSSELIELEGQPCILSVFRDFTDRKQLELALQQSEAALRRAQQVAHVGSWQVDVKTDRVIWSEESFHIFGWDVMQPEPSLSQFYQLVHPDDRALLQHSLEQTIATQIPYRTEFRIIQPNGILRYVEARGEAIVDNQGEAVQLLGTNLDITERHTIDRMKHEFISIVSHELRTPLTAIRGFLGLLDTGLYEHKPERARHMIGQALANSDRLVRLVNDILDLERLDAGSVQLVMEVCDAADLMRRSVEGIQSIADQSSITLDIAPTTAQVWADADAVIQTLTNLLSNAIKFSPADSVIALSAQTRSDSVLFAVKDQGRGIPADKLATIFERFQQVDVSDARQKGGTGLGLAICQGLVQQQGGKIWAESTPEEGSTFYFTLPLPSGAA